MYDVKAFIGETYDFIQQKVYSQRFDIQTFAHVLLIINSIILCQANICLPLYFQLL